MSPLSGVRCNTALPTLACVKQFYASSAVLSIILVVRQSEAANDKMFSDMPECGRLYARLLLCSRPDVVSILQTARDLRRL